MAQHDRQVAGELEQLHAIRDTGGDPGHQLEHALSAAARADSSAAVERLVQLTLDSLQANRANAS